MWEQKYIKISMNPEKKTKSNNQLILIKLPTDIFPEANHPISCFQKSQI